MADWSKTLSAAREGGSWGSDIGSATGIPFGNYIGRALGSVIGGGLGYYGSQDEPSPQQASGQMRTQNGYPTSRQGDSLRGYDPYNLQLSKFSPGNQDVRNQLRQQGLQNVNIDQLIDQARKNYTSKTIPSIAERFGAFGGPGTGANSAVQSALAGSAGDFESQLAALRNQFGMQQLQYGLEPDIENYLVPGQPGVLEQAAPGIFKLLESLGQEYGPEAFKAFKEWYGNKGSNPADKPIQENQKLGGGNFPGTNINKQSVLSRDLSKFATGSIGGPAVGPKPEGSFQNSNQPLNRNNFMDALHSTAFNLPGYGPVPWV